MSLRTRCLLTSSGRNILIAAFTAACLAGAPAALAQSEKKPLDTKPTDPFGPTKKQPKTKLPSEEEKKDEPVKGLVDLRPKFKKGDKLVYKMDLESKSKTKAPALEDGEQQQSTKQELGLVFVVKDVLEDSSVIELTFSNVKVVQETTNGKEKEKLEFDSSRPKAKDKENPLAPSCRELTGTTFTLTIDKEGHISNVSGGSGLSSLGAIGGSSGGLGGLGGGLGGGSSGTGGAAAGGNQGFADAIGSIFSVKKGSMQVKVGEKWSTADELDSGLLGKFRMITDSTLKSHSGNLAKVKVSGRIEPASQSPGGASMFQVKDSIYLGEYNWDTKSGSLQSLDMDQNVTIDGGSSSGGISMKASSKMKVNRLR